MLGLQLNVAFIVLALKAFLPGRGPCLIWVDAELLPLGTQLGVFLLIVLGAVLPTQEVMADGSAEFFSTASFEVAFALPS